MGISFISIFLLKAQVLNLTILKWKNFSLPLKVETGQVCLLFGFTRVSFCQNLLHFTLGQLRKAHRGGSYAESPFPLFCSLSASFKNSSPREKVGKLSSFWDWWV